MIEDKCVFYKLYNLLRYYLYVLVHKGKVQITFYLPVDKAACVSEFLYSHLCVCLSYLLMGGAVNIWMLHVGRFLTGLAGGMTAASIPVRSS